MAAAVTKLGTETFNTTSGTHTVVATPAVNDLIIIIVANTGSTASVAPTDNNADGNGTYTKITSALKATSADLMEVYVRNSRIGNASSTTFTHAPGTTTGGGLVVLKVTGMPAGGISQIRQYASQANQAAGTPAPIFSNAVLTSNPVIAALFNASNPATMTPRSSPAYTERADVGYSTPTTGLEVMTIDSGETASTITWGGSSASAFCSLAIEIAYNTAPTVVLNSPSNAGTVNTLTPQLQFTGTDADSDNIRYELQVGLNSAIEATIDSYSESNQDGTRNFNTGSGISGVGQSFTGDGNVLGSAQVYMRKSASPGGPIIAKIYAHSGTYGTSSVPTGAALATSEYVESASLSTTLSLVTFKFTGANQITLTSGTKYVLAIETTAGDPTNQVTIGTDDSSPTHGGNYVENDGAGYFAVNTSDVCFYVKSASLLDRISNNDNGFTDITNGAHTDPFTSGEQIGFTIPNSANTIAIDSVSSGRNSSGGTFSVSHTTGSGKDRMMIVITTAQDSNHSNMPVKGVTANGRALTKLRSDEATGNNRTEIWYLTAPDIGTYNVTVNFTGSLGEASLGIITLTGVKQTVPEANAGATGNSNTPSTSITTIANNAFTISVASSEASFSSVNNGQTVLTGYPLTDQSFENSDGASNTISTPGATTLSYTTSSGQSWAMSAVSLAPSGLDGLINGNTYYWRVRAIDPSGSNSYGAWTSINSFTVSTNTITTKTTTTIARITAATTKTITAITRLTNSSTKTIASVARITAKTLRTIPSISRITALGTKIQTAVSRITASTTRTSSALSRIQISTLKTISALTRIMQVVPKTIVSTARITSNTIKNQPVVSRITAQANRTVASIARITVNTLKTNPAIARITALASKTQPAIARIQALATKTQSALSRIQIVTTKTQIAIAHINSATITTTKTITSLARVTANTIKTNPAIARLTALTTKTTNAVSRLTAYATKIITTTARITVSNLKNSTAMARITALGTKTQNAVSRITAKTNKTIQAISRLTASTSRTTAALARITIQTLKQQPAIARILVINQKGQTALSRLQLNTLKTIIATTRITNSAIKTITAQARIMVVDLKTQPAIARIMVITNRTTTTISRIMVNHLITTPAISRITKQVNRTIAAVSNILNISTRTITSKAKLSSVSTHTQTATTHIVASRQSFKQKPLPYTRKGELYKISPLPFYN